MKEKVWDVAKEGFEGGMKKVKGGRKLREIGKGVEATGGGNDVKVMKKLSGDGVGK
ncbi:M24 family metallopeptidase [Staphylococcus auricularis]|uniref:hypothetical protein n=1 Tax=Staphylococcus auricularis TaxID=29379 RepID=UPI00177E4415|nr:hypothetical protein [Staphylococcus auricularis]